MLTYAIDRVRLAALYMKRAQRDNGLFDYEYDFVTGEYSDAWNIVRQAGAGYALAQYFLHTKDIDVADTVKGAIKAYAKRSLPYGDGHVLTRNMKLGTARSGATGLALLTELQYRQASGDDSFEDLRKQWLQGLLSFYRQGRGFAQSPDDDTESSYFNGEAWLSLAYYNKLYPDQPQVSDILSKLDDYLIDTYTKNFDIGFFHWGLLASRQRYQANRSQKFVDFIAAHSDQFLKEARPSVKRRVNSCYSIEGLGSAALVLDDKADHQALHADLISRIKREMDKNLTFQILPDQTRLSLRDGSYLYCKEYSHFSGAFINGLYRLQTRIDFTQHALSAMLFCRELNLYE